MSFLLLLHLTHANSLQFLLFSDLHYPSHPSCNKQLSASSCDTSEALLNSTLSAMSDLFPSTDLIISLGDEISHNQRSPFQVKSSISALFSYYSWFFPFTPKLHTIGNNEGFHSKQSQREYLDHLAYLYQFWVPSSWHSYKFLKNGYFSLQVASFKFLVLNSNHFTNDALGSTEQLDWVLDELKEAENSSVIILTHCPPVNSMFNSGERVWNEKSFFRFRSVVKEFREKILVILAGHLHRGTFSSISGVPVLVNPAVSPVYNTSPSFRAFQVDDGKVDFEEFVLVGEKWEKHFGFREEFGEVLEIPEIVERSELDDDFIDKLVRASRGALLDSEVNLYSLYSISTNSSMEIEKMRRVVWCSLNDYSFEKFMACREV